MCQPYFLGNKKFIMKNTIAFNSGEFRCFFTLLMIMVPCNVFLGLEYDQDFKYPYNLLILFTILLLEFISLYFFLRCTLIDPGIVLIPIQNSERSESNLKIIDYKNKTFVLKYCAACKLFRPLRAHHCRLCDLCIEELDHHCPWISNCVGRRNRKLFVYLLIFTSLLSFEILCLSIYKFIRCCYSDDYSQSRAAYLIAFIAISSIFGLSVFFLLLLQLFLILKGMTTNEYLRGTFNNIENPFDNGCCVNCLDFLKNDIGPRNISLNYLIDKKRYDDSVELNSKEETAKRNSDFSLEMNMMKTIEALKSENYEEVNGESLHKNLMNGINNAI